MNSLQQALAAAWTQQTNELKPDFPPRERAYVYASGIADCERQMYLDMVAGGDPFAVEVKEKLAMGDEVEKYIANRLGVLPPVSIDGPVYRFRRTSEQMPVEVKDRDGTLLLRGKIEGLLSASVSGSGITSRMERFLGDQIPYEIKSGQVVARAESVEDLLRSQYGRKYILQFLSYLLALNKPLGLLILVQPSGPRMLWVSLEEHLQIVELALQRVRRAVDGVKNGIAPDFTQDRSLCAKCRHLGSRCFPVVDFGEGVKVFEEEEDFVLAELCRTREKNQDAHEEWERADTTLKKRLRGLARGMVGGGRFLLEGKWQPNTTYTVPEEIKKQYAKTEEKGKFTLKIERLAPDEEAD